ncbi:MAG: Co2+/Mg2+ efflux protein ApaG [Oceanicaulis sp.]|uniref:Co2+/Mg2+ efflux protein ApaG n=1 Tax=Glycocaulis sp. TaxID=1969725 RepID=UPI00345BD1F9|nr:Co2+/Mg2+ efflux protein ApaG [Oceanicaulis sp.]
MYKSETKGVIIRVAPDYLETESEPDEDRYVWSYTVEIENHSGEPIQLLTREWHITDARGRTRIVRGDGVVGEQPVIEPGASFRYTSGAPLTTPSGFMSGEYGMRGANGETFAAPVPAFALDTPYDMPATRH